MAGTTFRLGSYVVPADGAVAGAKNEIVFEEVVVEGLISGDRERNSFIACLTIYNDETRMNFRKIISL